MKSKTAFKFEKRIHWGLLTHDITFTTIAGNPITGLFEARSAVGRAVSVDLNEFEIQLFPFFDLINANKGTNHEVGCCPESYINLGATVKDFVESSRRESAKGGIYEAAAKRCLFAMNALHTNFVRPNGFIVQDHQVIIKPAKYDALGLDCNQFMSLDGPYTAFVMDRGILTVDTLTFRHGELPNPPTFAISGPALIKSGKNVSLEIPFRPTPRDSAPYGVAGKPPFLKLPAGPTRCDEVNYPPPTTMTSFSAIGIAANNQLILLSMFEELRGQGNGCGLGITVYEMADLLRHPELNAVDAILSGGGADTQQFLKGDRPQFLTAPVRSRAPQQASRPEVEGPRGLGAILGVLIRP